jgi:hypothetical protein
VRAFEGARPERLLEPCSYLVEVDPERRQRLGVDHGAARSAAEPGREGALYGGRVDVESWKKRQDGARRVVGEREQHVLGADEGAGDRQDVLTRHPDERGPRDALLRGSIGTTPTS